MLDSCIQNPHLDGHSFFWEGGPTGVLLIHGYTATTVEVRLLAQALHEKGYTVAAPLLPGHGTTPEKMNRCRWQDWADACEQTYRTLAECCGQVFLGGESMGGMLCLYLAARHPDVAGLLLYAPALRTSAGWQPYLTPLIARIRPVIPKRHSTPSAADARWQGYTVHPMRATAQLFALQRVVIPLLPKIAQPLLIVQGRLDRTVHAAVPDLIAERARSAIKKIHWLERSTHCVLLDQEWEQAAALALDFIGQRLADKAAAAPTGNA
ncbi:MAG: alpha/beta hydrolase [Chloroflexota bacterium]